MFGEKEIVGRQVFKLDKDKKMKLPSFTYAEKDDELIIAYFRNYFAIYNKEHFFSAIDFYKEQLKHTTNREERIEIKKKIRTLFCCIIREVKCDKNKTIKLPLKEDFNLVICEGKRKHLEFKPYKK